jgi:hypothetical protein
MRVQILFVTRVMRLSPGPTLMVRVYERLRKGRSKECHGVRRVRWRSKVASRVRTSESLGGTTRHPMRRTLLESS